MLLRATGPALLSGTGAGAKKLRVPVLLYSLLWKAVEALPLACGDAGEHDPSEAVQLLEVVLFWKQEMDTLT